MEKAKFQKQKTYTKPPQNNPNNKPTLWDCGSSLYDSFELKSFERQLSSALVSRTLSMPHLSEPESKKPKQQPTSSTISRSIRRLVRSIFKPRIRDDDDGIKLASNDGDNRENKSRAGSNVVYDEFNNALSAKRDVREFDLVFARPSTKKSSSSNLVMRRSGSVADGSSRRASAAATSLGVSCA